MAFIVGGIVLVAIVLLAEPTEAAQLSFGASQTQSQSVVYACVNESVSLPWKAAIPTTDSIAEIKWYFHGNSDELIAIFFSGKFGPLPGFSDGRAEFLSNAGLVLHHVTELDKGNYSVVVDVLDASGQTMTLRDSVILQITDNPVHGYTELNITQHAEYSDATEQFHVILSCGKFLSLPQPPSDVRWETPSGSEVPSTSYSDGQFRLQLPNPVPGGSYTCRVPASSAVCGARASVHVDRVDARLTMLEAHNQRLMQENLALKTNISQYINVSAANQISFHARLDKNLPHVLEGIALKFSAVSLNQGGAYDAVSGNFTAPFAGVYFFSVNTGSGADDLQANVDVMVDDVIQCRLESAVYGDMGTCEAVLRLSAGQRVWLRSLDNRNAYVALTSSFTGFLIKAD